MPNAGWNKVIEMRTFPAAGESLDFLGEGRGLVAFRARGDALADSKAETMMVLFLEALYLMVWSWKDEAKTPSCGEMVSLCFPSPGSAVVIFDRLES